MLGMPGCLRDCCHGLATVRDGDIIIPKVVLHEPLKFQTEHFLKAIEGKEALLSSAEVRILTVPVHRLTRDAP